MSKSLALLAILILGLIVFGYIFSSPPDLVSPEQEPVSIISVYPKVIYPGDPVFISVHASSSPTSILFDKKLLKTFIYKGTPHALVPVDFFEKVLKHEVTVLFMNGVVATTSVAITPREKIEKPLGIPEKLGGDTSEASKALTQNLADENFALSKVKTASSILWTESFAYPLSSVFVTDNYGYDRKTVGQTIVHRGTDFRAVSGTEVFAMNDGVVEIATTYTVYGNTVVLDHGLGVHTLYMHLSQLNVKKGDRVKKGDVIGLSGETGYANAPHLHISVRVNGVSIDPVTFMKFFR